MPYFKLEEPTDCANAESLGHQELPPSASVSVELMPATKTDRVQSLPRVSVVIPTTFRRTLVRAVGTVLAQDYPQDLIELIIVADLPTDTRVPDQLPVQPIFTGGGAGAGSARQIGTQVATGEWIAFLDDDDIWQPRKLTLQMAAARTAGDRPVVVSCRFKEFVLDQTSEPLPAALCGPDQRIVDYLFRARKATLGRPSIPTSTLVVSRTAANAVPWDGNLRRHQDWDWLATFDLLPDRAFVHLGECLVDKPMGTAGSISASSDWEASLQWARSRADQLGGSTLSDFLAAQPLRYAVQARSWRGVREVLSALFEARRIPSIGTLVFGLSGLLPRRSAEKALALFIRATSLIRKGNNES